MGYRTPGLLYFFSYQICCHLAHGRGAISRSTSSPARSREFWHAPLMFSNSEVSDSVRLGVASESSRRR